MSNPRGLLFWKCTISLRFVSWPSVVSGDRSRVALVGLASLCCNIEFSVFFLQCFFSVIFLSNSDFIVLLHSPISNMFICFLIIRNFLTAILTADTILPNCAETAVKPNHSVHVTSFIFVFHLFL